VKHLIEADDGSGRRLYLRQKDRRHNRWTYWRWDAIRFETRSAAEEAVKRDCAGVEAFVVEAVKNMDFSVRPPKIVSRTRPAAMKRAERQYEERLRAKA
jgi:hypothetical protein